jgi:hypothetical protein
MRGHRAGWWLIMVIGVQRLWDLTLALDHAGDIAGAAEVLARAGINIDSVCCQAGPKPVTCHLLVGDGGAAAAALTAAGVTARVRQVAVCTLENRPGTLATVLATVNRAGLAVDFIYQATAKGLVIGTDAVDKLCDALSVRYALVRPGALHSQSVK